MRDYPPIELRCTHCGELKHYLEFARNKNSPARGYRDSRCRDCKRERKRELRAGAELYRAPKDTYPYQPDGMTREEVAEALKITVYQVRKAEMEGMAKLRKIYGAAA